MPPRQRSTTLARWLLGLLAGAVLVAATAWWLARPPKPDAFYAPPASLPARAGALIRSAPVERNVPADARAWRILYTTTRSDGSTTVASALVMLARNAPSGPRPVVAWTHGTTGVEPGCAPPLLDAPFANVPSVRPLLDAGWLYVATDYIGQGTHGPHPYLIGDGQARSALDAVRAARQMTEVQAGTATVVWGHSQGGHAALWTGLIAPRYAPDVPLGGVAAIAPAADLPALIDPIQHTLVGRIMTSYLLRAYSEHYTDVRFDAYSAGRRGLLARDMASRCLAGPAAIVSVASAALAGGSIFDQPPTDGPLGQRLRENVPAGHWPMPLLIFQGAADTLVLPEIQRRYVQTRCAAGANIEYAEYAGKDHLSVVASDSPLTDDLMRWTQARFDGAAAPSGCVRLAR